MAIDTGPTSPIVTRKMAEQILARSSGSVRPENTGLITPRVADRILSANSDLSEHDQIMIERDHLLHAITMSFGGVDEFQRVVDAQGGMIDLRDAVHRAAEARVKNPRGGRQRAADNRLELMVAQLQAGNYASDQRVRETYTEGQSVVRSNAYNAVRLGDGVKKVGNVAEVDWESGYVRNEIDRRVAEEIDFYRKKNNLVPTEGATRRLIFEDSVEDLSTDASNLVTPSELDELLGVAPEKNENTD